MAAQIKQQSRNSFCAYARNALEYGCIYYACKKRYQYEPGRSKNRLLVFKSHGPACKQHYKIAVPPYLFEIE